MHPTLPDCWESRALRVAMSEEDWTRLESLILRVAADQPTRARALGAALSYLMREESAAPPESGPLDWLDWELRKTLHALRSLRPGA
ncbi:hypothetical protein [Tautonia plasticadhaerens]|uniref:Uncharacterized protein n=1 Tax=Tautonia plasticadhaerens TaxID=2527974 RepID=A0A518GXD5_9BACT|nr:hypothetical protein [Tautonia plasticadhaerens]QDV33241.1 hypothetical protein ElP_10830 [Tautonia plasticadhaerens]